MYHTPGVPAPFGYSCSSARSTKYQSPSRSQLTGQRVYRPYIFTGLRKGYTRIYRAETSPGARQQKSHQNERFRQPVEKLIRAKWGPYVGNSSNNNSNNSSNGGDDGPVPAAPCDVSKEDDIAALWRTLQDRGLCSLSPGNAAASAVTASPAAAVGGLDPTGGNGGGQAGIGEGPQKIDIVLHSVAHAPTEAMRQGFLKGTTQEAFVSAHVVSAYSLVSMVRHGLPFLAPGASVIALTYIGSQRAAANYNVMGPAKASLESCARALAQELGGPASANTVGPGGVRVNCLSPGPVRTMAARGIAGFDEMRLEAAARAPLGRGVGLDEIAGVATFLASPLASAVTGQTVYADGGFSGVV